MITVETIQDAPVLAPSQSEDWAGLFDVQLLVARRADLLARRRPAFSRENDRRTWLRAEMEIFDAAERTLGAA